MVLKWQVTQQGHVGGGLHSHWWSALTELFESVDFHSGDGLEMAGCFVMTQGAEFWSLFSSQVSRAILGSVK